MFTIFGETLKILTKKNKGDSERIADSAVLYSDIVEWNFPRWVFYSANMSVAAAVLLPFLGLNSTNQTRLRNQLKRVAWAHNYEGKWKQVSDLVSVSIIPAEVLKLQLTFESSEAYFGNTIRNMRKIKDNMLASCIYKEDTRPVKKPQRKRGYNDKGHLRPIHESPIFKEVKERESFEEVNHQGTFYSMLEKPEQSDIAVGLLEKTTVKRNRRRRKTKLRSKAIPQMVTNNVIPSDRKIAKHSIFNYNGKEFKILRSRCSRKYYSLEECHYLDSLGLWPPSAKIKQISLLYTLELEVEVQENLIRILFEREDIF